jgi:iron complex outermembrane receptor protein
MPSRRLHLSLLLLGSPGLLLSQAPVYAAEQHRADAGMIEEVLVTARQREETLQDVPVTVSVITEEELDRYNISTLTEASKLVPNFLVFQGGSGNGSNIILRGIGSSSISAAFDQSVAINIDGIVVNIGRFIHNAYMDMGQIEVLKGPQSLYFGKSATAGVISIRSNDPGDEFEAEIMGGYEPNYKQTYTEGIISSPITDTLGARLAIGYTKSDEMFENIAAGRFFDVNFDGNPDSAFPTVQNDWRGEESLNSRLTLLWNPSDTVTARLKYSYTTYENDGANGRTEEFCPEGKVQPTAVPGANTPLRVFPGVDDCKLNGNTSIYDLHPNLRAGLPYGAANGVPFLDQTTHFISGQVDWDLSEELTLTSVTGWVDLDHKELDIYDYNAGVFGGLHRNTYESVSQEFRLGSNFDAPINFMVGAYYQEIEQTFEAYQYAFNMPLVPNAFGLPWVAPFATVGPDPDTGNMYDYNKNHFLDTEVLSGFLALYWDITEKLQITAGARYTDEQKDGYITIPYSHAGMKALGFGATPRVDGLEFEDSNTSPEIAVNYYLTPDISVYASYKEGFKSGGIDNSALPTNSLSPNNPDFPDFLVYDSETAEGYEAGIKGNFLDGALRIDGSVFTYQYADLQVQLFDSNTINFVTFNASELTTEGLETSATWVTEVEGLSLRGSVALTNTEYTDTFVNATGQDLDGEEGPLSADIAGFVGFTYDRPVFGGQWRGSLSLDARYNDGYSYQATLDPLEQSSFWLLDTAVRVYSADEKYEFSVIGKNMTDEIYAMGAGARPGACAGWNGQPGLLSGAACGSSAVANLQDQVVTTSLGAEWVAQFRVRF